MGGCEHGRGRIGGCSIMASYLSIRTVLTVGARSERFDSRMGPQRPGQNEGVLAYSRMDLTPLQPHPVTYFVSDTR